MKNNNYMALADGRNYSMNSYETKVNNNVVVVGTSGAGKTRSVVIPNLLLANGSYIVSDPKGTLYGEYGPYLKERGYVIKKLDFTHPENSDHYNCLDYIRNQQDIIKIANMLCTNQKDRSTADPFWKESASMLMSALIGYLVESKTNRKNENNFHSILELLRMGRRNSVSGKTLLEIRMDEFARRNPDSWAYKQFQNVNVAPDKTYDSILVTITAKMRNFDTKDLKYMMQDDDIDIASIGLRKTALFVIVSDTDRAMDSLANLFFMQALNELCRYADNLFADHRLPVPVRFILDDFATNCKIDDFPRMIATIRSRGISTMLMIQAESQLEESYGWDARTIIGNCDTYVYMGGNDISTAKLVAERCDMPLHKILNMPVGKNWIFRRGEKPANCDNIDLDAFIQEHNQEFQNEAEGRTL